MKNNKSFRIIQALVLALMLAAGLVNASNPDNVPIGIALLGVCIGLCLYLLFVALKQIELQEKQKEERLKQLEDEVALLKKR